MTKKREMVVELPVPAGGTIRQVANPIKLSETKPEDKSIGVTAKSSHMKDVLREIGYSDDQIEEFDKTGLFS